MKNTKMMLALGLVLIANSSSAFAEFEMTTHDVIRVTRADVTQKFEDGSVAVSSLTTEAGNTYALSCLLGRLKLVSMPTGLRPLVGHVRG